MGHERGMHMKSKKTILLAVCAALLLAGTVAGVYARYIRRAGDVKNDFNAAVSVNPTVMEVVDDPLTGMQKVSVQVGDTDYPVYVRAEIVITWQNEAGIVYFSKPDTSRDYELVLNLTDGWKEGNDGYYYYTKPVESGEATTVLISSCTQRSTATPPDGYTLSVEIIAQTVQAVGSTDDDTKLAYQDAWGLGTPIDS